MTRGPATRRPLGVFAAGLQCETNTFSPFVAGLQAFEEGGLLRGAAALEGQGADHAAARLWRDLSERDGHRFTPSLFALAHPSGPTVQSVYEGFRDEIVADLRAAGPVDVVLLFLHGAMVTTQRVSCEVDLVRAVRAVVGEKAVIGVELDPHCHLSQELIEAADAVVLMKEYPHDDFVGRARDLHDICVATALGEAHPCSAIFDCRMVGFYPTTGQPMLGFVDAMRAAEREPAVLSVGLAHGFPWGDMPASGSRVLVTTNDAPALAEATAASIGRQFYRLRQALLPSLPTIDEALDSAADRPGLTVLADMGDNPGGGAPGDNVALLRRMLARGVTNAAVGGFWDPMVARMCREAGRGAVLDLRLGGKTGKASGDHFDLRAVVRNYAEDHHQVGLGGSTCPLGLSAWIEVDGIDIVVTSIRAQTFDPSMFTGLGIDVAARNVVAVKSSQHFHSRFQSIAETILWVATPGALNMDFAAIDYARKSDADYFPRTADPLGLDGEAARTAVEKDDE
ncbi:M81 family metallopeptidase [Rhizorhabdus wittichii]|uniref:M81 family metallopeptidase n=1 Tax=Rhizorhabdus wittichii TaxID=160791 RepID=UPI0003154FF7|nr:M81 family metallopeptidase [Rhizorhabdus wittichii]